MRQIVVKSAYTQDLKKVVKLKQYSENTLTRQINMLCSGEKLPPECRDHMCPRGSRFDGYRNFHSRNDLCVIYKLTEDSLILYRIGTHATLKLCEEFL